MRLAGAQRVFPDEEAPGVDGGGAEGEEEGEDRAVHV